MGRGAELSITSFGGDDGRCLDPGIDRDDGRGWNLHCPCYAQFVAPFEGLDGRQSIQTGESHKMYMEKIQKKPPKGSADQKLSWRGLTLGLWACLCGPCVAHPARIWAPHLSFSSSSLSMELTEREN